MATLRLTQSNVKLGLPHNPLDIRVNVGLTPVSLQPERSVIGLSLESRSVPQESSCKTPL